MENSGLKGRRTRSDGKPFYVPSGTTSAEIVAEARTSVRSLDTKRPSTPVDQHRTLFGANRRGSNQSRPPSAFSIGPRHFSEPESPIPSNRLEPLQHSTDVVDGKIDDPEHVLLQVNAKLKRSLKSSKSVEPLQVLDPTDPSSTAFNFPTPPKPIKQLDHLTVSRRSSTGNISKQKLTAAKSTEERRVRSGPTQRTSPTSESEIRVKSSPSPRKHVKDNNNYMPSKIAGPKAEEKSANNDSANDEAKKLFNAYKEYVRPILKEMDDNLEREESKQLCANCARLLHMLYAKTIVPETEAVHSSNVKTQILKSLFSYLRLKDPLLQLRLAKLVLMFDVSESNEENIFKLIFKVSRNENNDQLFIEEQITDILIRKTLSFNENAKYESWIYCIGALKLLSGNTVLRKDLVQDGCIEALGVIVKLIDKQGPVDGKRIKQVTNLLIPVTAVLRNLADVTGSREILLKEYVLAKLVSVLGTYKGDCDVVLNICRILSKMTLYDECCSVVCSVKLCLETFLRVLSVYLKSQEIVVRVLFILGNLTAKTDQIRHNLYFTKGSPKTLLIVFQSYFERNVEASKVAKDKETIAEFEKTEDVLNKVIRVVANLSINGEVGPAIAQNGDFVDLLVQILETKELTGSEELVLNTVATINNLSYYADENGALAANRLNITLLLMGLLVAENMDAILEASRVFGNFSRFKDVRDSLASHKVDEMVISLLDSGNHEIVYTSCGVLINLMVDNEKRQILYDEGGIKKLIDVLRDFGKIDWQLAAMVCQTLWNYGENMTNAYETFGEEETVVLIDLLREYLDEDTAFDLASDSRRIEPSVQQLLRETWKENFETVGEQLLQKLESKQSHLLPLEEPS